MSKDKEYRCQKCGAQADERFDCCEVHEATKVVKRGPDSPHTDYMEVYEDYA